MSIITPTAHANMLSSYLSDDMDAATRVQVISPTTNKQNALHKLYSLIGIRKTQYIRPEIGTKCTVQSSAYAPSPYQTDNTPCITAAETIVRSGVVASNFLPLGTILKVNNEKFIVEDRMNPQINGYYIDIWFPSTSEALKFGRQTIEITIIGYGEPGQDIRSEKNEQYEKKEKDGV